MRFLIWLGVGILLASVDQLSKFIIFSGDTTPGNLFGLAHFKNNGFAFGLPLSSILIVPISIIALGVCFWLAKEQWSNANPWKRFGIILIMSGGLTNFTERLLLGYVRDPIQILNGYWNIADFAILIGASLWWYHIRQKDNHKYHELNCPDNK